MLMRHAVTMLGVMFLVVSVIGITPAQAQTLGFAQARQMVLNQNQNLNALREERAAAQEALRQASAHMNPEIEVETEDFGRAEVEVVLTQPIPIGGRRGAAMAVARRQVEMAELRLESGQISIEAELVRRFASVLSARRRVELVDFLLEVSGSSIQAIRRRVEAGAAMEIDVVRAELEQSELELERTELERTLAESEARLSELWGERTLRFEEVQGMLPGMLEIPPLDELAVAMERHPASRLLDAELTLIQAEIDEARAEGAPELALSAGYLRNNELEEETVIAGASLSLPVFNRNKGAVAEKRHEMAALEHQATGERLERAIALTALYSGLEGTSRELSAVSGELLVKARRIHDTLEEFYTHGKTGVLDVLEARSHLLELQMRVVDLIERETLLGADLVELTGYQIEIIR